MNSPARSLLVIVAVIAGLAELGMAVQFAIDGATDSASAPAAVFGVAFLLLASFVRVGKVWPVITLIVLFVVELAFIPMYARESWLDWTEQAAFAVISVVGIVAAVATVASRRRVIA